MAVHVFLRAVGPLQTLQIEHRGPAAWRASLKNILVTNVFVLCVHADVDVMFQNLTEHACLQTPLYKATPPREIRSTLITESCILSEERRWRPA